MIERIWHGWTTRGNADAYERLLRGRIVPAILGRGIAGFHGIDLMLREAGDEVEFVTVMRFESTAAVRAFAGDDHEKAVVPADARALLARFDETAAHYEVRDLSRDGFVTVVTRIAARPGMEGRVRQELRRLLAPTRGEEGCLNYDLHEAADRPGEFMFHENWTSTALLEKHLASAHIAAWRAVAADLLARPIEITLWRRAG
jgi:quinol monooxygenase YgiN